MLQTLLARKRYEEAMLDQHPLKQALRISLCSSERLNIRIIALLLHLNYIDNSSAFDSVMFPDGTNPFFEHKNLNTLFSLINQELQKVNEWFETNKLSVYGEKTKFVFS